MHSFLVKNVFQGSFKAAGKSFFPVCTHENAVLLKNIRNPSFSIKRFYSSSEPKISLQYNNGSCSLSVPLPLKGYDESRVFSFNPETKLSQILSDIESEDDSVSTVQFRSSATEKPLDTVNDLLDLEEFQLIINDRVIPVKSPVFTGTAYNDLSTDGNLDIRSITQKAAILKLRQALKSNPAWKISFREYLKLCEDSGIPKKQARELSKILHQSADILHFHNAESSSVRETVFLKPDSIIDMHFDSLGLTTPSAQRKVLKTKEIEHDLSLIEPEYTALSSLMKELDASAARSTDALCYLTSTGLVGSFGFYAWLSFIHFSWDIMEPVTYFTGFGVSIVGYAWWSWTNHEYEYENIYDYIFRSKQAKLYQKADVNLDHFKDIESNIHELKKQLDALKKSSRSPLFLQADLLKSVDENTNKIDL